MNVIVEDVFGNARAWSGGVEPEPHRPIGGDNREEVLRRAAAHGTPQRDGNRIFWLIRQKANILGVVLLHDPDGHADRLDIVALEHAATVLALEFAHQRDLAETELRLRRDLVEDLLVGTDEWLGPLLRYDREKKKADLVMTLTQYLDCGGELRRDGAVAHQVSLRLSTP